MAVFAGSRIYHQYYASTFAAFPKTIQPVFMLTPYLLWIHFYKSPAKGSIVEGAGSSQDFSYDCFPIEVY